jgi:MFS family permease
MLQLLKQRSFLILACISAIKFYDYSLLGLIAGIISKQLFSELKEPLEFVYQIIAMAVVIRPLGSYILGIIGDKKSRVASLRAGIMLITTGTILIAVLPVSYLDFYQIALWLLFARMLITGFITAEIDGLRIFIQENLTTPREKAFGNSIITIFAQLGALSATVLIWLISTSDITINLWRIPFIVGGILGIIVFYLARSVSDNEISSGVNSSNARRVQSLGLFIIFKRYKSLLVKAMLSLGAIHGLYYFQIIFFPTFLYELAGLIDTTQARFINCLSVIVYIAGNFFAAYITYKLDKESLISQILLILIILTSVHIYFLANYNTSVFLFLAICFLLPLVAQPTQLYLLNAIPISIRYRMYGLAHSLGSALIGSTLPFICTKLWYNTYLIWSGPCYFILLLSFLLTVFNFRK